MMKEVLGSSYLFGGNAPFLEELYESYLENPEAGPAVRRGYVDQMQKTAGARDVPPAPVVESFIRLAKKKGNGHAHAPTQAVATVEKKQVAVLQLINAYRFLGVR